MKQGRSLITFVHLAFAAVLTVYFGYYVFNVLNEPYRTTQVYTYTAHDSVAAVGLVVRDSLLLPAQDGILEITRAEGEKVGKGQQVALVYRDSQAQANQAQIAKLELDIQLLEESIDQSVDVESAARLDEDILQAVVDLRASYALGDYNQLRTQAIAVKSGVLKRGYTYGEGLSSDDLSAQLRALREQLDALTRQSARATTRINAPVSGVFSSLVDGFESRLNPEALRQLTPTSLQELIDTPVVGDAGSMGKLITSDTWYLAVNLPKEAAGRLKEGDTAVLRFSGDLNQDLKMNVDRIGPVEGKVTLVVFSSNHYLALATLLRHQAVELIFESWSGLRIPKEALHLEDVADSGADGSGDSPAVATRTVVYALVNGRIESRQVAVVHEDDDYYVVRPIGTGYKVLRDGDTIIIQGTGLQNGLRLEG